MKLKRNHSFIIIFIVMLLFLLPIFIQSKYIRYVIILSMINAILVSNWDLSLGYLGSFNFAHITFFLLGSYAAGVSSTYFNVSPWFGIIIGASVAVFASVLISLPALRVKGLYVILLTFAFNELCKYIIMGLREYTGGSMGLVSIPKLKIGSYSFAQNNDLGYLYFIGLLLIISTIFLKNLVNSDFGKKIIALKDSETYATSRGIYFGKYLILTFAISAIFTGVAGAVYSYYFGAISPELFGFNFLSIPLCMVLFGGIGTIYGPIVGAIFLTIISEYLIRLGSARYIIIALTIILIVKFYPNGLWSGLKKLIRSEQFYY